METKIQFSDIFSVNAIYKMMIVPSIFQLIFNQRTNKTNIMESINMYSYYNIDKKDIVLPNLIEEAFKDILHSFGRPEEKN